MPTFTIEYATDAERLMLEQAVAFVTDFRQLAAPVTDSSTGCPRPFMPPWILVPNPPTLRPRACSPCPPLPAPFFPGRQT